MAGEINGNTVKPNLLTVGQKFQGSSNEDLSEYTDADESISAPTEFLSEFLSSLMLKDYTTALKYCKLILHYEPNNATAREFYPLIIEKLEKMPSEDELSRNSSSEEDLEPFSIHSDDNHSESESDNAESSENGKENEQISLDPSYEDNLGIDSLLVFENFIGLGNYPGIDKVGETDIRSSKSLSPQIDSDATTNSYSSLEDEEVVTRDGNILEEIIVHNTKIDDKNGNTIFTESTKSPINTDSNFNWFTKRKDKNKNTLAGINVFQISSDSESPTDPVTQQTIQMIPSKSTSPTNHNQ